MRTANRLPPYPLRKLLLLFLPPSAPRGCRVGDAMGFPSSAPSGRERRGERRRDLPAGSRTHPTGEPTCAAPRRAEPSPASPAAHWRASPPFWAGPPLAPPLSAPPRMPTPRRWRRNPRPFLPAHGSTGLAVHRPGGRRPSPPLRAWAALSSELV